MKSAWNLLAIAAVLVAVLLLTLVAFRLPLGPSLSHLVEGAFGTKAGLSRTFVKATPLLLTSLGILIAWRAAMYNIGGEGQFVMGALTGAVIAKAFASQSPAILNIEILLATAIGGAVFASIAALLYVKRGVQVVVSTILLNFVALQVFDWAVKGPLQEHEHKLPMTDRLPDAAMLMRFDRQTDLHTGVFIALFAAAACWIFLFGTRAGYRLRVVGKNVNAARAARIDCGRVQLGAMILSGALCGLAGGVEYTALSGQLGPGFAQDWGFLAIPVALLGGLHPAGVVLSSLYFGALFAGTVNLARYTPAGSSIVYVIQAVAVLAFVCLLILQSRRVKVVEAD